MPKRVQLSKKWVYVEMVDDPHDPDSRRWKYEGSDGAEVLLACDFPWAVTGANKYAVRRTDVIATVSRA